MPISTLRRRRSLAPGRGISSLAEVPADPQSKVLHLCRYPEKCLHGLRSAPSAVPASGRPPVPVILEVSDSG